LQDLRSTYQSLNLPPDGFDYQFWITADLLFETHSHYLYATHIDSDKAQSSPGNFRKGVSDLFSAVEKLQQIIEKSGDHSLPSTRIAVVYMFVVELLCWIVIVVHQWVVQKTKKRKSADVRADVESAIAKLKEISKKLNTNFPLEIPTPPDFSSGILHQLDGKTEKHSNLRKILDKIGQDITKSHQQSRSFILELLATRSKLISNLQLNK